MTQPRGQEAIELEIYKHLFASIAEEMGERLMRSSYSPNIKERRDFSCALFDQHGDTVAQAAHIPVHLGSAPLSVKAVLQRFPLDEMKAGELFVVNDPYEGGTHLPDITVVAPFVPKGSGSAAFLVANRAHHADVGGISAGSMPVSTHIDEEGIRLAPQRLTPERIQWICEQTRTPDERRGDLEAQVAALQVGIERLQALCEQKGAEVVRERAASLQAYSERWARQLWSSLPDGEWKFTDVLEDDGHGTTDIFISCALKVEGDKASFDFRDSHPQVKGPVNAVSAITASAATYVLCCLLPEEVPINGGLQRSFEILTTPGTVVDAEYPAAVAAGNVETSQRLVDVLFGALAQALPKRIPAASCGSMNNLAIGGWDPRFHAPFAYYETIAGGAGASPCSEGASTVHTHMTNTLNTPVEALEHAYPMQILSVEQRHGSGGDGCYRGGDGLLRRYRFLHEAEVTLLTERRKKSPWGLKGGKDGASGYNRLQTVEGQRELPAKVNLHVKAGDILEVATPGGGGWGEKAVSDD
jgi:N-methylhydantoinase B